jgi:hypothetical protein
MLFNRSDRNELTKNKKQKQSGTSTSTIPYLFDALVSVLRILDVHPGSEIIIQHPGSRVKKEPGSMIRTKKLNIFNTKMLLPGMEI